ncbi:S-methyl-5'-thioadenosine phosphorylase [Sporichthya polymorpha]|uniref:S-methyl-5'-thioadenosine phosphorylase n=1 Tax=Sporichthya polymorpha TaxID=35751 RepID=UPI000371D957|nr:S-methyl-5'-thioadenosine phosphorylase [Sporichthya polymorpha]
MTDTSIPSDVRADIGVIGGSGLYEFLDEAVAVDVSTPYGPPSDPLVIGEIAGRRVAFLPRHGADHRWLPHRIPYRANLWALRAVGVRQVLAPAAVGSLTHELPIGALVVPDQVLDRTSGRDRTYFDGPPAGVVHVGFADPYCPAGRAAALKASAASGWPAADGATLVVIDGPRFSSRAESQWYAAAGARIIGMTGMPEAALARELALCYTPMALVTDLDAGIETGEGVTMAEVFAVFKENVGRLRTVLMDVVAALPTERTCACGSALDGLNLGIELP